MIAETFTEATVVVGIASREIGLAIQTDGTGTTSTTLARMITEGATTAARDEAGGMKNAITIELMVG